MTNAFILAGALGILGDRRIGSDVQIIVEADLPVDDRLKLEAQRREADRAREEQRRRERARANLLPHGSEREARRRRRQIERGQLKAENGLAR